MWSFLLIAATVAASTRNLDDVANCIDNETSGSVDSAGNGCSYYTDATAAECGTLDDGVFDANWDCCACGGGCSDSDGDGVCDTLDELLDALDTAGNQLMTIVIVVVVCFFLLILCVFCMCCGGMAYCCAKQAEAKTQPAEGQTA